MNKKDAVNILFCGTGGQGVLKASEICGWAALFGGFHVKKSEVHGMAQRGGSVESHLRFGGDVLSPLIPKGRADYLVSFDKDERDRLKDFLSPKGVDLIDYLEQGKNLVKDGRYINIFLLGVLSKHLAIEEKNWLRAIENILPSKHLKENREAFFKGRETRGSV